MIERASKKGHHDLRCPIFRSKSSEEPKKRSSSRPQMSYVPLNISRRREKDLNFCKCPRVVVCPVLTPELSELA